MALSRRPLSSGWTRILKRPDHFALHRHRIGRWSDFPLVCVLQSPLVAGPELIICPVSTFGPAGPTSPMIAMGGTAYFLRLRMMAALSPRLLSEKLGSAEAIRSDIVNGFDRLFLGS